MQKLEVKGQLVQMIFWKHAQTDGTNNRYNTVG